MKKFLLVAVVALACIHPFDWNKRIFPRGMDQVSVWAVPVKFQWNASTGSVAGYKLHQGTVSGTYTSSQDVPGTGTTGTMDMDPAASRYVAATAYDSAKRESAFSNEILCHPIVVSSTSGGTINPSGAFFVQDGRTVTFSLSPEENYRVKRVSVDGGELAAPYTIASVSTRTVVSAEFELIQPPGPPTMLQLVQQIAAALDRIEGHLAVMAPIDIR